MHKFLGIMTGLALILLASVVVTVVTAPLLQ